ncbi:MAG: hypothetical protein AN487_21375 [Anabaena sp. CRKS33]|nr:MAG: hypothetical protein AN487_21375 [Anabaena sp. CRKS33]
MAVVQHQPDGAALELGADGPQALGAGVGTVVEERGVLRHQHHGVVAHAPDDGLAVCLQQGLHADPGVL